MNAKPSGFDMLNVISNQIEKNNFKVGVITITKKDSDVCFKNEKQKLKELVKNKKIIIV